MCVSIPHKNRSRVFYSDLSDNTIGSYQWKTHEIRNRLYNVQFSKFLSWAKSANLQSFVRMSSWKKRSCPVTIMTFQRISRLSYLLNLCSQVSDAGPFLGSLVLPVEIAFICLRSKISLYVLWEVIYYTFYWIMLQI